MTFQGRPEAGGSAGRRQKGKSFFFFFLLEDSFFELSVVAWHEPAEAADTALPALDPGVAAAEPPGAAEAGGQAAAPVAAGVVPAVLVEAAASAEPTAPCDVFPMLPEAVPPTMAPPESASEEPGAVCVGESGPLFPTGASPVAPVGVVSGPGVPAAAGLEVPGVTVSTTAVVPAPPPPGAPADIVPGVSDSLPASSGGSRFGAP